MSTPWEHTSVFVNWATAWIRTSTPAFVSDFCITAASVSAISTNSTLTLLWVCSALYGRELEEEDEEEEEEDEQLEVHRLPDLLFRKAPQLLQYTAALHSRYDSDYHDGSDGGDSEKELEIQRERRGELRLDSSIGTVKQVMTLRCMLGEE